MKNFSEVNFLEIESNDKYTELINKVIGQAFLIEKLEKTNLYINIILTNSNNIKTINKKFRNIDKETDVLSFPMFEKEEIENILCNKNNIKEILGDIVISIPRVQEQAKEYGHSFERELAYMLVHGFYHLMGYDHIVEEEKEIMRQKEEEVLNELKILR